MKKRIGKAVWARNFERHFAVMTRIAAASGARMLARSLEPVVAKRRPPPGDGAWTPGFVMGSGGTRRFRLYRPPEVGLGERLPLMVMLHGCGQDANGFAVSTRMNRIAKRERFLVLYPEQDRLANPQRCWNWFDTGTGRAYAEAALILRAIDQVCLLHPVDKTQVAIAGLSAGASMAALLATRYPERFKAVVMHSGVPPGLAHSTLSALGAMQGRRTSPLRANRALPVEAHWPPLLVIHGDADAVVSPRNGRSAAQEWARAVGARAGPTRSVQRGRRYPMSVTDFRRRGGTVVTHVAVDGLSHAWSGGAASGPFGDGRGPDASRMAWAFAARQFRRAA